MCCSLAHCKVKLADVLHPDVYTTLRSMCHTSLPWRWVRLQWCVVPKHSILLDTRKALPRTYIRIDTALIRFREFVECSLCGKREYADNTYNSCAALPTSERSLQRITTQSQRGLCVQHREVLPSARLPIFVHILRSV